MVDAYPPPPRRRKAPCDPARPPRYWAPEAWRLYCAVTDARQRLAYATADARLLDGVEKWLVLQGKGKPVPGPWWSLAVALTAQAWACLSDEPSRRLLAPWARPGAGPAPADVGFRPLGG